MEVLQVFRVGSEVGSCGSEVSLVSYLVWAFCDTEMCPEELRVSERRKEE